MPASEMHCGVERSGEAPSGTSAPKQGKADDPSGLDSQGEQRLMPVPSVTEPRARDTDGTNAPVSTGSIVPHDAPIRTIRSAYVTP